MKKILAVILLLALTPTHAALIDSGTFFTDTDSGLDWLKLAPTLNRSYSDVSSNLGVGQEFDGWRYASGKEFEQLLLNGGVNPDCTLIYLLGVPIPSCTPVVNFSGNDRELAINGALAEISAVSDLLGNLAPIPPLIQLALTQGLVSDIDTGNIDPTARFAPFIYLSPNVGAFVDTFGASVAPGEMNEYLGSYLVRASVVPVPPAVWLFGSALGLLGWRRRITT